MASERTDRLIDAMGQIDARYIEEARLATPFTFARLRRKGRRVLPVLLAAALSLVTVAAVMIGLMTRDKSGPGSQNGTAVGPVGDPMLSADPLSAQLLHFTPGQLKDLRIDPDIPLQDGVCRLVWTTDRVSYYGVTVTDPQDLRRLSAYLNDPKSFENGSGEAVSDTGLYFWICTGSGYSVSPYLLYGAWGVGNLFDYSPETLPSSDFVAFLVQLIHKNLD